MFVTVLKAIKCRKKKGSGKKTSNIKSSEGAQNPGLVIGTLIHIAMFMQDGAP